MGRNRLLELVTGVAILALIGAVLAPQIVRAVANANEAQVIADSRTVAAAEEAYASANFGFYAPIRNLCSAATCNGIGIPNYTGPDFISPELGRVGGYVKDGYYRTWIGGEGAWPPVVGSDPESFLSYCYSSCASEPYINQFPVPRAFSIDGTGHLYEDDWGTPISTCPIALGTASALDSFHRQLAVDFGSEGLYQYDPSSGLTQLSAWDPELITAWSDGIAVSFGSAHGLWSYGRNGWTQLTPWAPYLLTSERGRVFAAFDSGRGIWKYEAGGSTQITDREPVVMEPFGNRLAAAFGSGEGIWLWSAFSGWLQVTSWDPYALLDSNGMLLAAFDGGRGVHALYSGFVLDIEIYGFPASSLWQQVTSSEPEQWTTSIGWNFTGDFGTGGIWRIPGDQLHTEDPYRVINHDRDLVAAFAGAGLHLYDETTGWSQLTPWDPIDVVSAEEYLAASFTQGLYRYDTSGWTQLSSSTAESIVTFQWETVTPDLSAPVHGSTLSSASETLNWTSNGAPFTEWWLYVGTSKGLHNVHDSGSLGASLSTTVSGLPVDGRELHVRLWYRGGGPWQWRDYQLTAATISAAAPAMSSPPPGATLSSATEVFNWTANGTSVTEWWLYVGTSTGLHNVHDSGSLGASLSTTVNNLPVDGRPLHMRLWYRVAGLWQWRDYAYTAATIAAAIPEMSSPAPGATLSSATEVFNWTTNGTSVTEWWLYLGTSAGLHNLHDSGSLGTSLSTAVNNLPTDGRQIHVRLWYRVAGLWQWRDFTYTAATIAAAAPAMSTPTPGSTLAGVSEAFTWTANGATVTEWWLYVGTSPGLYNLHDSGSLGTSLSTAVNNFPTDGRQLYVRLWYRVAALWLWQDYPYSAAP